MLTAAPALAGTPSAPRDVRVHVAVSGQLEVTWHEPIDHGGADSTSYKIQWRSGAEAYSDSRQSVFSSLADTILEDVPAPNRMYVDFVNGLVNGRTYTVRVIATNAEGDGTPSAEASKTPFSLAQQYARARGYIRDTLVPRYAPSHPWVRNIWEEMNAQGTEVTVERETFRISDHEEGWRGYVSGSAATRCEEINPATGLPVCRAIKIIISQHTWQDDNTYIHEMAHLHTLGNNAIDRPGPIGIGGVYLAVIPKPSYEYKCNPSELYASLISAITLDKPPTARHDYWDICFGSGPSALRTEALGVVRSALRGEMPAWLATAYPAAGGGVDRERLWNTVKTLHQTINNDRHLALAFLQYEFGGYCNSHRAAASVLGQGATRDP